MMDEAAKFVPTEDARLDITREHCPMTFVRVRLALDRMAVGQILLVLLAGDEPKRNVPVTARELGHDIVAREDAADGVTQLWIRRR